MNKLGAVLSLAAVVTLAGCKDPNFNSTYSGTQAQPVSDVTTDAPVDAVVEKDSIATIAEKHCTCPAGTKHAEPCTCGAADCQCVVEAPKPAEPETTVYIVQRGDYLAKISKKYNVTIAAIKKLNNLKSDNIRLGQKLKLPGKIEVGKQKVPEGAIAKPVRKAPAATAYEGPTKEYVVKLGDTLGHLAYANGINIRQLKALNGLTKDSLHIGQKLKIPATKAEKKDAAPAVPAEKPVAAPAAAEAKAAEAAPVQEPKVEAQADAPAPVENKLADLAETAPTVDYVVQEGEDMTAISMSFGVSAARIRELNNLSENDQLKAGQVLKLPAEQL